MKKVIIAALLLASVGFSTISCNNNEMAMTQSAVEPFEHLTRFKNSEVSGIDRVDFYRDTRTNIVYIQVRDYHSERTISGFTPYLNSEGNPMNYDEWKELYNVD